MSQGFTIPSHLHESVVALIEGTVMFHGDPHFFGRWNRALTDHEVRDPWRLFGSHRRRALRRATSTRGRKAAIDWRTL